MLEAENDRDCDERPGCFLSGEQGRLESIRTVFAKGIAVVVSNTFQSMSTARLIELYQEHERQIFDINLHPKEKMNGPFLISSSMQYERSPLKVAFIGQETRGWARSKEVIEQVEKYASFEYGKRYYASPFWNTIRKIEKALGITPYSSAWLNINRYDQNKKRPSEENLQKLSELDFILREDLIILQPDILILFTGPKYDERIRSLLEASFTRPDGFKSRQASLISSSKIPCKRIYRTYHPNYLRRSGLENKLISFIKSDFQGLVKHLPV